VVTGFAEQVFGEKTNLRVGAITGSKGNPVTYWQSAFRLVYQPWKKEEVLFLKKARLYTFAPI